MTYTVRLADPGDAVDLAPRLRPWDLVECLAAGVAPATALTMPFASGDGPHCWALEQDGLVIGMGGLTPMPLLFQRGKEEMGHGAAIWFLGSAEVEAGGLEFLRLSRVWVDRALAEFPLLVNIIPERCVKTIRWLEWLGFDMQDAVVHLNGIRFVQFRMSRIDGPKGAPAPR
jgi:hypothetical protein